MDGVPRRRTGFDVRSPDVGAAAASDQIVDFDDRPPLAVPGVVDVLSTWLWQGGLDTRWWLGAIVEARSATSAAERVAETNSRAVARPMPLQAHARASSRPARDLVIDHAVGDRRFSTASVSP